MQLNLDDYRILLLDASFFAVNGSKEILSQLSGKSFYVAETLQSEISEYQKVCTLEEKSVLRNNLDFIRNSCELNSVDMQSFGDEWKNVNNDFWELMRLFNSLNQPCLVLTGNQLLIERIVLNKLSCDIYDAGEERILLRQDFLVYQKQFDFKAVMDYEFSAVPDFHEGSILYKDRGEKVVLGNRIAEGAEAQIYIIQDIPDTIAKVYTDEKMLYAKYYNNYNIVGKNEELDCDWVQFPAKILYHDPQCTNPAGFTETFIHSREKLADIPLFTGDVLSPEDGNRHLDYAVDIVLKVVRQVIYLNYRGFYFSDYNLRNFSLLDNPKFIQMWDSDSFGYRDYFSNYFSGQQMTRDYYATDKKTAIDACMEALYVFAFYILALGFEPIGQDMKFKFDSPNCVGKDREILFSRGLWKLFEDVFHGKRLPSETVLLKELSEYLETLRSNPEYNPTYNYVLYGISEEETRKPEKKKISIWMILTVLVLIADIFLVMLLR